jgi:hypothetical protein
MSAGKKMLDAALMVVLVLIGGVIQSCKKEYCWRCETQATMTFINNPTPSTSLTENQLCDKTAEEIEVYEKNNTHVTQSTTGGQVVLTTSTVTYCDKN